MWGYGWDDGVRSKAKGTGITASPGGLMVLSEARLASSAPGQTHISEKG